MGQTQRLLLAHNHYQQPGGEDQAFDAEANLLDACGHRVIRYTTHNDQLKNLGSLRLARIAIWNDAIYREMRELIRAERPDVVHFHNTFPLISPAAYYAAKAESVPVVQTLHNYRLLCPNALFFRDERVCEDCLGKAVPWPGVLHSCYRGSRAASGVVAAMLTAHRVMGTWSKMVDVYISPSEFTRKKLVQGGLPEEKVAVKPHFVHPKPKAGEGRGGYAVFVGRLSPEKGLDTLLSAWEYLGGKLRLKVVGDGPLASRVAETTRRVPKVEWLGRRPPDEILKIMGEAVLVVVPSKVYETFGRVVIEGFAKGTPVVGSKIGAIAELVEHGRTGLHYRAGDPEDLAAQVRWALAHPAELERMRAEARGEFEARYTAERNYHRLKEIYQAATS
jgi:glycosyltransferase involved in cell wall biosynthesis